MERCINESEKSNAEGHKNAQKIWNQIVTSSKEAAVKVLGNKSRKQTECNKIKELSEKQKKIYHDINSTQNPIRRKQLRDKRNILMEKIHNELTRIKQEKIEKEIQEIEALKDDSNRMYRAVRNLQRTSKKAPLVIDTTEGKTTDPGTQVNIISDFFNQMFTTSTAAKIDDIPPQKMRDAFTKDEVTKAIRSLKNGKSPGADDLSAEYLKHGPDIVHHRIAELLNHIAETGDFPNEIKHVVLIPLQKPGKKKGPTANLRPVKIGRAHV